MKISNAKNFQNYGMLISKVNEHYSHSKLMAKANLLVRVIGHTAQLYATKFQCNVGQQLKVVVYYGKKCPLLFIDHGRPKTNGPKLLSCLEE